MFNFQEVNGIVNLDVIGKKIKGKDIDKLTLKLVGHINNQIEKLNNICINGVKS